MTRAPLLLAVLLAACLGGCADRASPTDAEPAPAFAQVIAAGEGAPGVTLTLDRTALTMIDRAVLRLALASDDPQVRSLAEPDVAAALPLSLRLVSLRERTDMPRAWEAVIEPLAPGEHEIGAIELRLTPGPDAEVNPDAAPRTRTPPVRLTVSSFLSESELTEGLAGVKEVVEPPIHINWGAWIGAGAVAIALLLAGAWLLIRMANRPEPPVLRPAHDIARERLDRLMASGLVERSAWKDFYLELSLILRRYIEDRFSVHAPERTTEEFLAETRYHPSFSQADLALLERFLLHCDMVKFAAADTTRASAEQSAETVRAFVDRTADPERLVVVTPQGAAA